MWIAIICLAACSLGYNAYLHYHMLKMAHSVAAMEQRFFEAGINLQEELATEVRIPERWQESEGLVDDDVIRPQGRMLDEWRELA